jgi:hypothetical protein
MTRLTNDLAALATMSPAQLRAEWRRVLKGAAPALPPNILRRGIAYRMQERIHGSLPTTVSRELDRIAAKLAKGLVTVGSDATRLKPGMRLIRSWQGRTYTVLVSDNGFILDDRSFSSLSQVAKAITGVHWSGPRFFGIGRPASADGARKHGAGDGLNDCDAQGNDAHA